MQLRKRLLVAAASMGLAAATLVASPAQAVTYKTCTLTMPKTWEITVGTRSDDEAYYPFSSEYFSGDCPSLIPTAPSNNPYNWDYDYESGGTDIGWSGMTFLMNDMGSPFPLYEPSFDYWDSWYISDYFVGRDENGNEIREQRIVNSVVDDWYQRIGKTYITSDPVYRQNVWTGNEATEDCDYDISTCPGGYTYDNYKFVVANTLTFKYETPLEVKAKKSKGRITFSASMDRSTVTGNFVDDEPVTHWKSDRIKVYRNGKLLKTKKFVEGGFASYKVRDKAGSQTYKVCVPETRRAWKKCVSFVK